MRDLGLVYVRSGVRGVGARRRYGQTYHRRVCVHNISAQDAREARSGGRQMALEPTGSSFSAGQVSPRYPHSPPSGQACLGRAHIWLPAPLRVCGGKKRAKSKGGEASGREAGSERLTPGTRMPSPQVRRRNRPRPWRARLPRERTRASSCAPAFRYGVGQRSPSRRVGESAGCEAAPRLRMAMRATRRRDLEPVQPAPAHGDRVMRPSFRSTRDEREICLTPSHPVPDFVSLPDRPICTDKGIIIPDLPPNLTSNRSRTDLATR